MSLKGHIGIVETVRKQAQILVCITEPLYCAVDVSWNAETHTVAWYQYHCDPYILTSIHSSAQASNQLNPDCLKQKRSQ